MPDPTPNPITTQPPALVVPKLEDLDTDEYLAVKNGHAKLEDFARPSAAPVTEEVEEEPVIASPPAEAPGQATEPEKPAEKPVEKPTEKPAAVPEKPLAEMSSAEILALNPNKASTAAKRKEIIQAQIDTLTSQRYDTQRELDAARAEISDLRKEAASIKPALQKPVPASEPTKPVEIALPADLVDRPRPKPDEIGETYPTVEEFELDLAQWSIEQSEIRAYKRVHAALDSERQRTAASTAEREQATRIEQVRQAHTARVLVFRKQHPDFDTVAKNPQLVMTDNMAAHFIFSESGPALVYYLGEHPEESVRLANLPVSSMLVEMGKLEARLSTAPSNGTGSVEVQLVQPRAPAPLTPVGPGAPHASRSLADLSDDEYIEEVNRREREALRRR